MTEAFKNDLKKLMELMGLKDASFNYDEERGRVAIFFEDGDFFKKNLSELVSHFDHLIKLMAKKKGIEAAIFVDVNNYRRERENLILELAKGAARKAVATKEEIPLPPMNAYERRLIHSELASRPDVKTESAGEGRERHVVVKPM